MQSIGTRSTTCAIKARNLNWVICKSCGWTQSLPYRVKEVKRKQAVYINICMHMDSGKIVVMKLFADMNREADIEKSICACSGGWEGGDELREQHGASRRDQCIKAAS